MASKSIPILVTGQTRQIATAVIAAFKPDYEVIHFTFLDSCTKEIPLLLKGEVPSNPDGQLGSGNWSVFPKAILFGGGYTDNDIAAVRKAVAEVDGARKIPWLRVDVTKPAPPVGPGYGAAVVARAKEELKRLEAEGVFDSNDDSIRLF